MEEDEFQEIVDFFNKRGKLDDFFSFLSQRMDIYPVPTINDIWYSNENAISYWLLVINGIDNSTEAKIAKDLLFWRECFVGDDAQVRCIHSPDKEINKFCTKYFKIDSAPTLIFSRDKNFTDTIKIGSGLIAELAKGENSFRDFVSEIHREVIMGKSINQINKNLKSDKFWNKMKLVYGEVKSFVTVNIKSDAFE